MSEDISSRLLNSMVHTHGNITFDMNEFGMIVVSVNDRPIGLFKNINQSVVIDCYAETWALQKMKIEQDEP